MSLIKFSLNFYAIFFFSDYTYCTENYNCDLTYHYKRDCKIYKHRKEDLTCKIPCELENCTVVESFFSSHCPDFSCTSKTTTPQPGPSPSPTPQPTPGPHQIVLIGTVLGGTLSGLTVLCFFVYLCCKACKRYRSHNRLTAEEIEMHGRGEERPIIRTTSPPRNYFTLCSPRPSSQASSTPFSDIPLTPPAQNLSYQDHPLSDLSVSVAYNSKTEKKSSKKRNKSLEESCL